MATKTLVAAIGNNTYAGTAVTGPQWTVVSAETRAHEQSEIRAILADGAISYVRAVRSDINRYHSGPQPLQASNWRAVY